MSIDPRLAERRQEVAEDRARRNVGRLIRVLTVVAVLGALTWLLLSPLLSVKEVTTAGIVTSDTHRALVENGVLAGTPMILIRPGQISAQLEDDPWVREADVELDWPSRVVVRIEERVPVAWVESREGWESRAVDGVALPSSGEPDDTLPWIRFPTLASAETGSAPEVLGSLQFAEALPGALKPGADVWAEDSGELWADVAGFQVRLGRAVEMSEKAVSLDALLAQQPEPGSILILIAPTHPAVLPPGVDEIAEEAQP